MIIKSQSRKEGSFRQLMDYIAAKAEKKDAVFRNVFAREDEGITREFEENARHLKERKGGNFLYHEILSISLAENLTQSDLRKIKTSFRQIAESYLEARAPDALAYGNLHTDHKHHLHYHLMISANARGEERRRRLSKTSFDGIKRNLENRVLSHYPELNQKVSIGKKAHEKLSKEGGELKRRTGKMPERDSTKEKLKQIFETSKTKNDFFQNLEKENLEIYIRGNSIGFVDKTTDRKHRLKTLGLEDEFEAASRRIDLERKKERGAESEDGENMQKAEKTNQAENTAGVDRGQPQNQSRPDDRKRPETQNTEQKAEKIKNTEASETKHEATRARAKSEPEESPEIKREAPELIKPETMEDLQKREIESRRAEMERVRNEGKTQIEERRERDSQRQEKGRGRD